MAITWFAYPWSEAEQKFLENEENKIPFTLGDMSEEYYFNITHTENTYENREEYLKYFNIGYFYDNVVRRSDNILGKFTYSGGITGFGLPLSEFTNSTGYSYGAPMQKFKITDDITLCTREYLRADARGNGKADISYSLAIHCEFNNVTYKKFDFPFQCFQMVKVAKEITYEELLNVNGGFHFGQWLANSGFVFGINAYPNSKENVAVSVTTTGCMLDCFSIIYDVMGYYTSTTVNGFFFKNDQNSGGYSGSVVKVGRDKIKEVPYLLSQGYEVQFPSSEEAVYIGNYGNNSDSGEVPSMPMQSALNSGMVRMYQMDTTQLNAFAKFLWNADLFDDWEAFINTLKQWFENPLDSIISLNISPVDIFYDYDNNVTNTPNPVNIKLTTVDTGVKGLLCQTSYKQISMGKLNLKPYYNSYLDCNPHTRFSIYLPYIGFNELDPNVLFSSGGTFIEVVYSIDVMTGVCVANILIEKESNGTKLKHVIYSFSGNVNTQIPISSSDMKSFINATFSAIASGVAIGATGGAATPLVAGSMAAQQAITMASQKVNVAYGGGMSLETGMFGIQYPYLIITRPREARPTHHQKQNGLPSEIGGKLSAFSGFTQVSSVKVEIPNATEEEKNEIERLLKEGVYV